MITYVHTLKGVVMSFTHLIHSSRAYYSRLSLRQLVSGSFGPARSINAISLSFQVRRNTWYRRVLHHYSLLLTALIYYSLDNVLITFLCCELAFCDRPSNVVNGKLMGIGSNVKIDVGTSVLYTCNVGYTLSKQEYKRRTCLPNRKWSGTAPYCYGRARLIKRGVAYTEIC